MKIRLLMPLIEPDGFLHFSISALINDEVAIDAGGLGYLTPMKAQRKVQHLLLTHSHIDHIASLPVFLDNVYTLGPECPTILASQATWDCLEQDIFNDRVWPNLRRISSEQSPFYHQQIIEPGDQLELAGLKVTPLALEHAVPTLGFIVRDENAAVLFAWDTAPLDNFEQIVREIPNLKAIFIECSFPNSMQWLADNSKHLCPSELGAMALRIPRDIRLIAVHLKPAYHQELINDLGDMNLENIEVADRNREYVF